MRGRLTTATLDLVGEADGLAAERIILAQRVPLPVILHDDPSEVGVPLEADPHQVPRLPLVPVGRRPDRHDARDGFAVVEPHLDTDAWRTLAQREQVVVDREPLRLRRRDARVALGSGRPAEAAGEVEVAPEPRAVVPGHAARTPAEVVGRGEVGEEAEALDVTEVETRLHQTRRVDDERRLAVLLLGLDKPRYALEDHYEAT